MAHNELEKLMIKEPNVYFNKSKVPTVERVQAKMFK